MGGHPQEGVFMKGHRIVWLEAGKAAVEEFELPLLPRGQVLIKTDYSVVSAGTERAVFLGMPNTPQKFPMYLGYSVSGRIIETGQGVEGLNDGDRVIVYPGSHASHIMRPVSDITRIEDATVSARDAAFLVIGAFSLAGLRKARVEIGESVLVIGLGLLGLFAVQIARIGGAMPVLASDFDDRRRRLAQDLGADYTFTPAEKDFVQAVKNSTGGKGADVVIEVTGSPGAMQQALESVARRGRIILLGCTRNPVESVDFYKYVHRPGVSIIGAHTDVRPEHDSAPGYWTMQDDLKTLLRLLAAGRIQVKPMVHGQVLPEEAPDVYRRLAEDSGSILGYVFDWNAGG